MEHRRLDQLDRAEVLRWDGPRAESMSFAERLDRWAQLLEAEPTRVLRTLDQTESYDRKTREGLRCDNSMLSVAFNDPVLRADGLADDTYGEAKRFFGLSDGQLHHVVCYCHFGRSVMAGNAAQGVRSVIPRQCTPGLLGRLLDLFRVGVPGR